MGRGRGRAPCCDKTKVRTGPWTPDEDSRLVNFVQNHGHTNWRALPKQAGLLRCGKSCRLRWINYLRPDVKRGNFTPQEEESIIQLHHSLGNQWSKIASCLPGRTDNEIKNVWNTHLKKRLLIPTSKINSSHDQVQMKQNDFLQDSPSSSSSTNLQELLQEEGGTDFPWELDDVDLWEIWESLDSLLDSNKVAHHNDNDNNNINIIHVEEEEKSDEFVKWLRCLENELGLTTSDGDETVAVAPPNFDCWNALNPTTMSHSAKNGRGPFCTLKTSE